MRLGLGLSLSQSGGASGPSYDTDAQLWFNAVATAGGTISAGDKTAYNAFIAGLKTDGIWAGLDDVLWSGAADSTTALIGMKSLAAWTAPGCTFNAYGGWVGDGASTTAGVICPTAIASLTHYQQDDACLFVVINQANGTTLVQQAGSTAVTSVGIGLNSTANGMSVRLNSGTSLSATPSPAGRSGFAAVVRDASNTSRWLNPVTGAADLVVQNTGLPGTVPTGNIVGLRRVSTCSPDRLCCIGMGKSVTGSQVLLTRQRVNTLGTALSCPTS